MNGFDLAARGLASRALQAGQALGAPGGAELVGTSFGISAQQRFGERVSILEAVTPATHEQVLAGTNDDDHTAGINNLISQLATAGGGTIELPKSCRVNVANLVPQSGVTLRGGTQHSGSPGWQTGLPLIRALPGAAWIVEAGPDQLINASFEGINFTGNGVADPGGGIRIPNWFRSGMTACVFSNFADQGLYVEAAHIVKVEDVLSTNCLMERNRLGQSGAIQFDYFVDSYLLRGEHNVAIMSGDLTSPNLYCAAVAILGGASSWIEGVIGEQADVGFVIVGERYRMKGCRSDLNRAHGYRLSTRFSEFRDNHSWRNGQAADATYHDFMIEAYLGGQGIDNTFDANQGYALDANRPLHTFKDTSSLRANPNTYALNRGSGGRGSTYSITNTAEVITKGGHFKLFTNGDTTPSVDNHDKFEWVGASATSITALDDGVDGQIVTLKSNTSNITLVASATLVTLNSANRILLPNKVYQFIQEAGIWYELPHTHGVRAGYKTVGDADFAPTHGAFTTIRYTVALTANRKLTLPSAGASAGDRYHVVRSQGGSFNLDVWNADAGSISTFTEGNQAGVFEFDGTNWFPSA